MNPELQERIRIQREKGVGIEEIKKILRIQGYTDADIDVAVNQSAPVAEVHTTVSTPTPPLGESPVVPQSPAVTLPEVAQSTAQPITTAASSASRNFLMMVVCVLVLFGVGGGLAYAYVAKIGPFGHAPYTEANLISGLLASVSNIHSNAYSLSASIAVAPRESGAEPFSIQVSNEDALRAEYENDASRIKSVSAFLSELERGSYPSTLQTLLNRINARGSYYRSSVTITDPKTGLPYSYHVTDGGKDFQLTVNFETKDALRALQITSRYASSTVLINGQTATFTKHSSSFIYFSAEPPKPYLELLGEYVRFLPAEISASLSASAVADWSKGNEEWKFNIDASGDFGDLTYKVNADALKKNGRYYFRVNNIPSIFGEYLASVKGQWVVIDSMVSSSSETTRYNEFSTIASELPNAEARYKENRAALFEFTRKVAGFADEERLLQIKNPPHAEHIDGRILYRYDLMVRKEAIVPFYTRMVNEAAANKGISEYELFSDPGMIDYLQSPEFSQVFDYLQKNTTITAWVDESGYPGVIQYTMRIVPPDTAVQLKDKQVNLTLKATLNDINKPVVVDEPTGAKPIQDIIDQVETNTNYSLDNARSNGRDARRTADIKAIQLGLELYYDAHNQYPHTLDALAPNFISALPKDPSTKAQYQYAARGTGANCTGYHLGAVLEATNASLSSDADAAPTSTCTGSAHADFHGKSLMCTGNTPATAERCFDVSS